MGKEVKFEDYIGQQIKLFIPRISGTVLQDVKLLGIEASGLWVESQTMTNAALEILKVATAPKTFVYFFPYHEIAYALAPIDAPALQEKAFGV
jgi:hypothetical protein